MAEKPEGINPKDLIGSTKVDLSLIPPTALIQCALAMTDGGLKYGPYNWREPGKPVQARTYLSANGRHTHKWGDGEDYDPESLVHHLGHAMACCAILIDAQATGCMADNRAKSGRLSALMKDAEAVVKHLNELAKARKR